MLYPLSGIFEENLDTHLITVNKKGAGLITGNEVLVYLSPHDLAHAVA